MCPRIVYVAPSLAIAPGGHGACEVLVFFTWKATGISTVACAAARAGGARMGPTTAASSAVSRPPRTTKRRPPAGA